VNATQFHERNSAQWNGNQAAIKNGAMIRAIFVYIIFASEIASSV
jgi:hypothetical protein